MIVAFVQFPTGKATAEEMRERYRSTAPKYRAVAGLVRKYYVLSENGQTGGGVYLFESKEAAEKLYTQEWRQYVEELYGAEPVVQYFECPVVVDNTIGKILTA